MADATYTAATNSTGPKFATYDLGASGMLAAVEPRSRAQVVFSGYVQSFMTPGRASTSQNLLAVWNADPAILVDVSEAIVSADVYSANGSVPLRFQLYRITAIPTNGTALTVSSRDTTQTLDSDITAYGDASGDGTGSGTTLTATAVAPAIVKIFGPRLQTADGPVPSYYRELLKPDLAYTLRQNQGLLLQLATATAATGNPATNMYFARFAIQAYSLP